MAESPPKPPSGPSSPDHQAQEPTAPTVPAVAQGPARLRPRPVNAGPGEPDAETRPAPAPRSNSNRSRPTSSSQVPLTGETALDLEQGTRIERYIVLKPVGRGGMGVVYAAYDPDLDRKVALKLMRPDRDDIDGPAGQQALLREAQAMARVSHPNVLTVHDVGTLGSQVFVTMEFIQGSTLHDWVRHEPRTWQQVLRVFQEAGQGLAAAHRAGLVHRDFKPANVLISHGGRVYVMDFGLARLASLAEAEEAGRDADTPQPPEGRGGGLLSSSGLSDQGLVMGTPQYMAPEQHLGIPVDARADQFAFCAALYRSLYRQRPFEAKEASQRAAEAAEHAHQAPSPNELWRLLPRTPLAREPPKDKEAQVPPWLWRALSRGMSTHPDDRFPSMEALLETLAPPPRRAGRRGALVAAGLVGLASAITGVSLYQQSQLCAGAEELVASVWGPGQRQKLEAAFAATGRPFAADSARQVVSALESYARGWADQHTQACEATRVRGEQTEELLAVRMVCLERRRQDLRAMVGVFTEADAKLVDRAVDAAGALPALEPCQDIVSLSEQPALPADPARRQTLAKLGEQLSQVSALTTAGRFKPALELARQLQPQVAATGWLPLQAELSYHQGFLQVRQGEVEPGLQELERAYDGAEKSRVDRLRLESLIRLIHALANNGRGDEAQRWGMRGAALLARLGNEPRLHVDLMGNLGNLALLRGRYREAWDYFERARAQLEPLAPTDVRRLQVPFALGLAALKLGEHSKALELIGQSLQQTQASKGRLHPQVAERHTMLATTYRETGDVARALEHANAALEIRRTSLGAEHPTVAESLDEVGMGLIALKRHEEALASFRDALRLKHKVLGPEHPDLSYSYDGIGQALLAAGRPAEAVEPLEKALAFGEVEPEALAQTGFALAQALWAVGKEPARARAVAAQARERYVKLEKPEQVARLDAWLAAHPGKAPPAPGPKKKERRPRR